MQKIILFVDDEPAILSSIKRVFRKSPHKILTASTASEALTIIRSTPVCLLVSDYSMPDTTGANLLAEAKLIRPEMVRIILSGNNDQEATIQSINHGSASRFLTKPWDDKNLVSEIESALEQWESEQYFFKPKQLLNHQAIQALIDDDASNESNGTAIVAYISINKFEVLKNIMGPDCISEFLINIAPEPSALGDHISLGLMTDQHFCAYIRLAEDAGNPENAITNVLEQFTNHPTINDQKTHITFNVGYALTTTPQIPAATLIGNSFSALQQAKTSGFANMLMHTDQMNEKQASNLTLEKNLNVALDNNEFELFYQPKINLENRSLYGAEALIRWKNKELGMVSPFEFIPLAERSNLINEIGEWVIVEAFGQWAQWFSNLEDKPLISVNVSPIQLNDTSFMDRVERSLDAVDMDPKTLEFEITENLMLEDLDTTITILNRLKDLGLKISIDDFGTGYSSLSYLNKLPVDIIKIDRSFILPMLESDQSLELVKNLIRLGHDLGMQIVAEGVEDEKQLLALNEFGCDVIQGYYFSPPVPAMEFIEYSNSLTNDSTQHDSSTYKIAVGH